MTNLKTISKSMRKYAALIVLVGVFSATGYVSAAGKLTISQTTGLTDGQVVSVSGSGLLKTTDPSNPVIGAILECNGDPSQPQIEAYGNEVPVSCSLPTNYVETTDANGAFSAVDFTVHTGTIGPPCTPVGTSSCPSSAASEAAQYPCPPTAAEIAKGITCNIQFGDSANGGVSQGDDVIVPISFASSGGGQGSGGGSGNNSQSSVTSTSPSGTGSSTLVNTGPGQIAFVSAILAAVTGSALFLAYKQHKVRS